MTLAFPPPPTASTSGRRPGRGRRDFKRSEDRPPTLDLELRHLDVRRIARANPLFRQCLRAGWEADDLDSEVMARVLARQGMSSRYDPERGSVGKYLTLLCQGILLNLLRKKKRERAAATFCELNDDDAGAVLAPIDDTTTIPKEEPMALSVPVPVEAPIPVAPASVEPPKPVLIEAQLEVADVLVTVKAPVSQLVELVRALARAA